MLVSSIRRLRLMHFMGFYTNNVFKAKMKRICKLLKNIRTVLAKFSNIRIAECVCTVIFIQIIYASYYGGNFYRNRNYSSLMNIDLPDFRWSCTDSLINYS